MLQHKIFSSIFLTLYCHETKIKTNNRHQSSLIVTPGAQIDLDHWCQMKSDASSAWQANDTLVIRVSRYLCVCLGCTYTTVASGHPQSLVLRASWYTGAGFLWWRIDCSWCDNDISIYICEMCNFNCYYNIYYSWVYIYIFVGSNMSKIWKKVSVKNIVTWSLFCEYYFYFISR